jgi:hypothetical protein
MFRLDFKISGNPDRRESNWEESHSIEAPTIAELRAKISTFKGENDIGGGNWGVASLYRDDVLLGFMSYNLRIWDKPYWDTGSVEIIL